jgi:hypothetical protein
VPPLRRCSLRYTIVRPGRLVAEEEEGEEEQGGGSSDARALPAEGVGYGHRRGRGRGHGHGRTVVSAPARVYSGASEMVYAATGQGGGVGRAKLAEVCVACLGIEQVSDDGLQRWRAPPAPRRAAPHPPTPTTCTP